MPAPFTIPITDRVKVPVSAATRCKSCPVTTVDLKLTVSPPNTNKVSSLPKADFLAVTWTRYEAVALSRVFGKGRYSFNTGTDNNLTPLIFDNLSLPVDSPAHAFFFQATVNNKSVLCLKSEFHPKFQTAATSIFFEKVLAQSGSHNFKFLITTGTAGGIWESLDVGDVVVTNRARYGLTFPREKQQLPPYTGVADVVGAGNPPAGSANWFDYANRQIIAPDACVSNGLDSANGRKAGNGKPKISYQAPGAELTDVVTNSRISEDEHTKIDTYRTLGATLDENDAYLADACSAVSFKNWVSIRNVSDIPGSLNQY